MGYALRQRLIEAINNNEHRYRFIRRWLHCAAEIIREPWVFLNHPPRCYIRSGVSIEDFFYKLKRRKVQYVVLRWFDDLPRVPVGEDIDLLVQDEHLIRMADLVSCQPGGQPLDIYTVKGNYRRTFRGRPYFPAWIAQEILRSRMWKNEVYAVPAKKQHLLSLVFHALFHKGDKAFATSAHVAADQAVEHDYPAVIAKIARELSISVDRHDSEAYFCLLDKYHWAPTIEYLRFWSQRDPLLQKFLPGPEDTRKGQLVLFIVRSWALRKEMLSHFTREISMKFEILGVHVLRPDQIQVASMCARGGNWSRGLCIIGGGEPAALIVGFDYHPEAVDGPTTSKFPFLSNKKLLSAKHSLRDQINKRRPFFLQTNPIHSCDDETEALDILRRIDAGLGKLAAKQAIERRQNYNPPEKVLSLLPSHRTRSKLEIVTRDGTRCVKKTYQQHALRFFEREISVLRDIGCGHPNILPLIEYGHNFFTTPYVNNILNLASVEKKQYLLSERGQEILNFIRFFYEKGYALIDFKPDNIVMDENRNIYIVDFEFLHRYTNRPATIQESYDIAGIPMEPKFDTPLKLRRGGRTWDNTWLPVLGDIGRYL